MFARQTVPHRQAGYTLVELVIALVLSAGIFSALMLWFERPLHAMLQAGDRTAAVEVTQRIVDRLALEIESALPNSVRIACNGRCLEFIPVLQQGDYRAGAPGDLLDLLAPDSGFDVLDPLASAPAPGSQIVINNLSAAPIGPNSAYSPDLINNRATVVAGTTAAHIAMLPKLFPAFSPTQRFFVVDTPVSYLCDLPAGTIRRLSAYAIQSVQPANTAAGSLLGEGIVDCEFQLIDSRLVALRIAADAGDTDPVMLFAQFRLVNEP